ncbi:MAG: PAS domain S-box protein [Desulfomonile tiedjei]|nr:PAS domain S-box protein [Desulfomonile tiedjei]
MSANKDFSDPLFRVIVGVTALLGALHFGLFFFRESEPVLAEIPMFVPMIHGFIALIGFCVAFLALGRHRALHDPASYWTGIAFAAFSILAVFYVLSWPGLRSDGRAIIGHLPEAAVWNVMLERILVGGLLMAALLARWPGAESLSDKRWGYSLQASVALFVLLGLVLVTIGGYLPSPIGRGGAFTPLVRGLELLVLLLFAAGAVFSTRRYLRSGDTLYAFLALTQVQFAFGSASALMAGKRYALLWYLSGLLAASALLTMLFCVLWEYVRLYQREQEKSSELEISVIKYRQAEEQLKESEAHLKRSQAIANLGSWELDVVNNVLTWSDEVYRIFGLQPQEFMATYEAFLEAVHPDDRDAVNEAYSGSLRDGKDTYEIEHRVVRNSTGEIRHVREKCHHVRDETDSIIRSLGMVHDITERKRAEEALREAKKNLEVRVQERTAELERANRSLHRENAERQRAEEQILQAKEEWERTFDAITDPIMILDAHHKIVKANQAMAAKLGTSPSLAVGLSCHAAVHGTSQPPPFCPHARLLADGEPHSEEIHEESLNADFHVSVSPLFDRDGSLFGSVHYMRDITEQKRAQEEVKAERQRLYDVLDTLPAYVVLLKSDYHVPFANRYFRERFGESNGMRCFEYLFGRTEPCEICETYTVLKTKEPHSWEWTGPDGRNYDVFDCPFTDSDGSLFILEMGIDVTERHLAEEDRKLLISDLEAKNLEMERFIYSVSHDLRSPLITIKTFLGFVQEALATGDADGVEPDLCRIDRATDRMGQLLDEILELSRIGRLSNPPSRVPAEELISEALELLAGSITRSGVEVRVAPDLPVLYGDRPRLLEVFQNLIENAAKFSAGQPHPQVEVGCIEQEGEATFYVRDNGMGIDPSYHAKVFRLFEKLDPESDGTGIGLALVKRIVEVLGGRIWVDSQGSGQGTTFYFTLPWAPSGDKC